MEEMTEKPKSSIELTEEAIKDVGDIISSTGYNLDELKDVEDPNILVVGLGTFFPESRILKRWADKSKKEMSVYGVDKDEYYDYIGQMSESLSINNAEYFKVKTEHTLIEDYLDENNFVEKFDLVLILRSSNLDYYAKSTYKQIAESLKKNGVLIISGASPDTFSENILPLDILKLEYKGEVEIPDTDTYLSYPATNKVYKFRKAGNGV